MPDSSGGFRIAALPDCSTLATSGPYVSGVGSGNQGQRCRGFRLKKMSRPLDPPSIARELAARRSTVPACKRQIEEILYLVDVPR